MWRDADADRIARLCAAVGVRERFIRDGVPPTFRDAGLRGRIERQPLPKGGLYICGPIGSHKTHLLAARTVDAARRGYNAKLINWSRFCLEIRQTYAKNSTVTELEILDQYSSLDYLGIDDLGIGRADRDETDASVRLCYELLDERYGRSETITDTTSNLTPGELASRFDERIARRISEMCTVYPMLLGSNGSAKEANGEA